MKIEAHLLKIKTTVDLELINITKRIREIIEPIKVHNGFLNIFSKHTTLAIVVNEDEELLKKDVINFFQKISRSDKEYLHDNLELRKNCPKDEPKNASGHLKCILLQPSQQIPIIEGKLQLGTYQEIFAVETSGPREREIIVQVIGELY